MTTKQIPKLSLYLAGLLIVFGWLIFAVWPSQAATAQVILTWSTDTYIPYDYIGKALPVPGSLIEVVANLTQKPSKIKNLDFDWSLGYKAQNQASGRGQQVFKFLAPSSGRRTLAVQLEIRDQGKLIALESLTIQTVDPQILIYSNQSPFLAVKKYQLSNYQQIDFRAVSYFFNTQGPNNLDYQWIFGHQKTTGPDQNPDRLTLNIGIENLIQPITQNLEVRVENKNKSWQKAKSQTQVTIIP